MGPAWPERAIFGVGGGIETAGGRWEAVLVWWKRRGAVDERRLADWWENKGAEGGPGSLGGGCRKVQVWQRMVWRWARFSGRRRRGDSGGFELAAFQEVLVQGGCWCGLVR